MARSYNKGEWSELYAFIKLLKEGRIYAADANAAKIEDVYLPIIKMIREERAGERQDFFTGEQIRIYKDNALISEFPADRLEAYVRELFYHIFSGGAGNGSFEIPGADEVMDLLSIQSVKASAEKKVDIQMQVHDINTGFAPEVGFSVKSDLGSPPTLLNPGKNTRFRYRIYGIDDSGMDAVNAIVKTPENREYMKARMDALISYCDEIEFHSVLSDTYEDNLLMIDSALPEIYGALILEHYLHISEGIYDCNDLIQLVAEDNPLSFRRTDIYRHKFKKLLCASALGMTPGKPWDGMEAATGGYIIIKRDGDVLCYHIYNRNYFEEYLVNNTRIDRPSASRYDYGYVFKDDDGDYYIDLNVQVRFKSL